MRRSRALLAAPACAVLLIGGLTACGGDETDAFCEQGDDAFSDVETSDDPATGLEALQGLQEDAPSELQGDLDVLVEQYELAVDDPTALDTEALTTAAENIGAWQDENCG